MGMGNSISQMEAIIVGLSKMEKLMAMVDYTIQTVISISVNGLTIKLMATESIFLEMVVSMKDIGSKIKSMGKARNPG